MAYCNGLPSHQSPFVGEEIFLFFDFIFEMLLERGLEYSVAQYHGTPFEIARENPKGLLLVSEHLISSCSQDVARSFGAVCTSEFLLFKKDGRRPFEFVYHGQFDDARTAEDLSLAIGNVLSGQPVSPIQKPSIKWKPEVIEGIKTCI